MTASDAELPERRELRDRLAVLPARLDEVTHRAEHYRPAREEWSTWKVALHRLAVEEDVWQARLREMRETENPVWKWTELDLNGRRACRSIEALLGAFAARRRATVDHLASLDDAGWRRFGTHAAFGALDVADLMREALPHDAEHVGELERPSTL